MKQVDKIPYIGRKLHKIGTWIWYMRWYFNLGAVAIPWSIVMMGILGFNIFVNIWWNRWWAGGNIFLMAQTLYHVVMGLHTAFLLFEFEIYLRPLASKVWRIFALMTAVSTTIAYFAFILKWILMVYFTSFDDEEQWDAVSLFEAMFLGYNILLNVTILPINWLLISKEITMPFIQFLSPNAGHNDDDISINTDDIRLTFLDFLNPFTYWNMIFYKIFNFSMRDLIRYNPENPKAYIKNWFKK